MRLRNVLFFAVVLPGCGDGRPAVAPAPTPTTAKVIAAAKNDVPFDNATPGRHLFRGAIDTATGKTPAACRIRNMRTECWGFAEDTKEFSKVLTLGEFDQVTGVLGAAFGPVATCVWTELGEAYCSGYFREAMLKGAEKVAGLSEVIEVAAAGRGRFCARSKDGSVRCFAGPGAPLEPYPFPSKVSQMSHEHPLSCVVDDKGEGFNLDRRLTFSAVEAGLHGKAPVTLAMCSTGTSCVLDVDHHLLCTFEKSLKRKQITLTLADEVTVADGEADRLCYASGSRLTCVGTVDSLVPLEKVTFASNILEIVVHGQAATIRTDDGNVWSLRLGAQSRPERLVAR